LHLGGDDNLVVDLHRYPFGVILAPWSISTTRCMFVRRAS